MSLCKICFIDKTNNSFSKICLKCKFFDSEIKKLFSCKTKNEVKEMLEKKNIDIFSIFFFLCNFFDNYVNFKNDFYFKTVLCLKKSFQNDFFNSEYAPKEYELQINWILDIIYKYVDFTDFFVENINNHVICKKILLNQTKINWFKTFNGGQTILEIANLKCKNKDVVIMVNEKYPQEMILEIDNKNIEIDNKNIEIDNKNIEIDNKKLKTVGIQTNNEYEFAIPVHKTVIKKFKENEPPSYESIYPKLSPSAPLLQ
jgi:hypothetical protein